MKTNENIIISFGNHMEERPQRHDRDFPTVKPLLYALFIGAFPPPLSGVGRYLIASKLNFTYGVGHSRLGPIRSAKIWFISGSCNRFFVRVTNKKCSLGKRRNEKTVLSHRDWAQFYKNVSSREAPTGAFPQDMQTPVSSGRGINYVGRASTQP